MSRCPQLETMRSGVLAGRNTDKVHSQRTWGKSVEDIITVGITVKIVVKIVDVELNECGPSIHGVELPLSIVVLLSVKGMSELTPTD